MACVSGLTNGVYSYVDCCGQLQVGASVGESICIDESYTGATSGLTYGIFIDSGTTCSINCSQGILSYDFQVTGTCSAATGSVIFTPFGGIPPYTIDNIIPGTLSAQTSSGDITFTGLTGSTYVFRLNDSLGLQNNELYINVIVSPCFEANIYQSSGTTCGSDNGFISVSATTTGSPYNIILYKDGNPYQSQTTNTLPYNFINLPSGIYYAKIFDYGSATANTENAVITSSTSVDYGLWKVNTSTCVIDKGKLAVTGLTGSGPFTYSWNNGETTQLVTGLTQGTYTVTVTDSLGCSTTKSETIGVAEPLVLLSSTPSNPSCFSSNGSVDFVLSGGSAPFFYSAITNEIGYTLSNTFTISNLGNGSYPVLVRDANNCEIIVYGSVGTFGGFNVTTNVINSNCNQNNGEIQVTVQGQSGTYTYTLSGLTNGLVINTSSTNQSLVPNPFINLSNDTYLLTISGTSTACTYSNFITLTSQEKFPLTLSVTGSTCGSSDGNVEVIVGTGFTGGLTYVITDVSNQIVNTSPVNSSFTALTFNNLSSGSYTISVTDGDNCTVSENFIITTSGSLVSFVNSQDCTDTELGTAEVIITQGEPTFTYEWSSNVPANQTGSTVNGLTGGSYSVIVTDSNGCKNLLYFEIKCGIQVLNSYELYSVCNDLFDTTSGNKRGFFEMLNEGFVDVTSGYTNCVLSSATFSCNVDINGSAYTQTFYTATTLNSVPSDSLWVSTIEGVLSTITDVGSYTIDLYHNTLQINSNCSGDFDPLGGADISIELAIEYNVNCESSANTICFGFTGDSTGYTYTSQPIGLYNGKNYYEVSTGSVIGYVYWNNVDDVWYFTENLGSGNYYSYLDNFYNVNPESNITYLWSAGTSSDIYMMTGSTIGSCP